MKTLPKNKVFLIISCIAVSFITLHHTSAYPGGRISFQTFYDELAPFGSWVQDVDYGYVWIPDVPGDFQPYATDGHWVMTEYGNTWVSDYSWGWAPFHYGRWRFDDYYGWMWVPGTEWGPAWVAWRSGGGYYGWAPLVPGLNISISVNIGRYIPNNYWVFVRQGYISHPHIYRYCVPRRNVVTIVNHTTIINNTYVYNNRNTYYTGPGARDIERSTHRPVQVHRIQQVNHPGTTVARQGAVNVYRPSVRDDRRDAAPRRTADHNSIRSGRSDLSRQNISGNTDRSGTTHSGTTRSGTIGESRPTTGSTRSYQPNAPRGNTSDRRIDNTAPETRERIPSRSNIRENTSSGTRENTAGRNRVTAPDRSNTRESTSNRARESTPARTRESYSSGSKHRESNAARSGNTERSNNRATPGRGSSQVRGQQQRQQPAARSSQPSRQSAGQQQGRVNTRSRSDNHR